MVVVPMTTQLGPIFRTESGPWYQTYRDLQTTTTNNNYLEKRQLFLRSYQFSRKQSIKERLKRSLVRVKRLFLVRVRTIRRLRKVVWPGLRLALYSKRRKLSKLLNQYQSYYYFNNYHKNTNGDNNFCKNFKYELFHASNITSPSCFW